MKEPGTREILVRASRTGTTMSTSHFWMLMDNCKILFLSPHPDDLGLCLGGILAAKERKNKFMVMDFFTRSVYAPNLKPGQRKETVVSRERLLEEYRYCDRYGVEVFPLDWPDSSLRGYTDDEETKGILPHDKFPGYVKKKLEKVLAKIKPDIIFCPLAIGNHIDHSIVLWALLQAKKPDALILYYEDLPYVSGIEPDAIRQVILPTLSDPGFIRVDITSTMEEKLRSLQIYKSTLTRDDLRRVRRHAGRLAAGENNYFERLWLGSD